MCLDRYVCFMYGMSVYCGVVSRVDSVDRCLIIWLPRRGFHPDTKYLLDKWSPELQLLRLSSDISPPWLTFLPSRVRSYILTLISINTVSIVSPIMASIYLHFTNRNRFRIFLKWACKQVVHYSNVLFWSGRMFERLYLDIVWVHRSTAPVF